MNAKCLFCPPVTDPQILSNELAFAIRDSYPTTDLHCLVIPHRHVSAYFDLTQDEIIACNALLVAAKKEIETLDDAVTGFNVGINVGKDAGQSIMHCHFHLIPRRSGDVDNPQGGIRHLIPGRGHYQRKT